MTETCPCSLSSETHTSFTCLTPLKLVSWGTSVTGLWQCICCPTWLYPSQRMRLLVQLSLFTEWEHSSEVARTHRGNIVFAGWVSGRACSGKATQVVSGKHMYWVVTLTQAGVGKMLNDIGLRTDWCPGGSQTFASLVKHALLMAQETFVLTCLLGIHWCLSSLHLLS